MPMQTWQKKKTTAGKAFGWYVNLIDASPKEESNEEVASKTSKKNRKKKDLYVPFSLCYPFRIYTKYLLCWNSP